MVTIKSYTDIEQSKKLAEIFPLESADMCYEYIGKLNAEYRGTPINAYALDDNLPCWSLAALLGVLPSGYVIVKNYHSFYYVESRDHEKSTNIFNNPIDACYEMIIKLKEKNLL